MKKITLIVFMFLMAWCGYSQGLPLEKFESNGNSLPTGWTVENVAGPTYTWTVATHSVPQTPAYQDTGHAAYLQRENMPTGQTSEDWLITKSFTAPANGQLRFMSRLTQIGDNGSTYRVMIFVGATLPAMPAGLSQFQEIVPVMTEFEMNPEAVHTEYIEKVYNLPVASFNQTVFVAFVMNGDNGDRWLIDNVVVAPPCLNVTSLPTTNIGTNTATLNWNNPANVNNWLIDIVPALGAPTGVGISYTGLPPYVATTDSAGNPLTPATAYKYYVKAICAEGVSSGWAGPFNFTTVVPGTNCTAPIVIPNNTFSQTSNTNLYGDDFDGTVGATGCSTNANYLNGDEVVYAYTPTYTGTAGFSMTNNGPNSGMFIYNNCTDIGVGCAAGGVGNATNPVNINLPVVAGQTYYVVISTSGTTQSTPYTLTIQQINCAQPVGLPITGVDADSANLSWTNPSGATSWQVVVQVAGTGIPTGAGTTANTNTNYVAGPLVDGTTYEYYVRADCGNGTFSAWAGPYTFTTTQIPVDINGYVQNFEGAHGFALSNGTQVNKWIVGTAVSNSPVNSLYITNDNGATNNYTIGTAAVVHAYRDLQMPAAIDQFTLSFDWKSGGEGTPPGTVWDYFKVWLVPATFTPTPGTLIAAGPDRTQIGGFFNLTPAWTTPTFTVNAGAYAGTVMRLIFEWRNDTSGGTMPGAAIDNININLVACPSPVNITLGTPFTSDSAIVNWTGPTSVTPTFDYVFGTSNTAPTAGTIPTGNVTTPTVPFTGLTPSTTYYFWVRSNCGGTNSAWVGPFSFTTPQIPAIPSFSQDFETPAHQFTLSNGNYTNKWVYGEAVSNSPTHSIYISNTNGTTHNYSTSSSAIVHAYRDIQLPTPLDQYIVQYDWRNNGENNWDFIRVWVVPVTYVPVPGTQISVANSGGFQLGGNHQLNNNWTTATHIINAGATAGTIVRLVFEWTSDTSGGVQQPGAIDNVNVQIVTCPSPSALVLGPVTQNTAAISWTGPASVTPTYDYYYSTTNTAPTAATVPNGNVTPTNVGLTGLNPSTNYFFWVRSNCGTTDGNSIWIGPLAFTTPQIPQTLNYTTDFEDANHQWTLSNGTQTNQWHYGTAVSNSPTHSLYISNTNGTTHNYSTSATSVVHAYRDLVMPTPLDQVVLQYDWRNMGENGWDYIRVWVVPVTYFPVPGTQITVANSGGFQLGGNHQGSNTWATATHIINAAAYAGTTVRLVFEWRNDGGGGTQQPGAIDNINIQVVTCPSPTALTLGPVTQDTAQISWTGPSSVTPTYDYYYSTSNTSPTAGTAPTGNVTPTNVGLTGLTPSTQYFIWVRSNCGAVDGNSVWIGPLAFTTTQIPAELEYEQDFEEADHQWTLSNGTQTNKWVYGEAVSNSPTHSLYISNTNGTTHNYSTSATSVVHAYRDILVPADVNMINIAYDWRNLGENGWDYIRLWVVPATFTPVPGTQITAASGGIQLGGNHQGSNTWANANYNLATPGAAAIYRVVFEWRNDGGGGSQQPGAIDNVNITIITCPPPANLNVDCVSSIGANITWEPGGDETEWEYTILPVGSPAPTTGTDTEETGVIIETLNNNTTYTVYVRALCSDPDELSSWTQANFTTTDVSIVEAEPFCGSSAGASIIFNNTFGQGAGSGYGQVACLGSTPNPVWYYLQVETDGQLDFRLIQNTQFNNEGVPIGNGLDVDFAAFGPFTSLTEACGQIELADCPTCPNNTGNANFYPFGNIVDCSYDAAFIENFTIPNAVEGQIYAVLITNFNGAQGQIQLQQLDSSTGTTNCDILYDVALGPDKILCGEPNTTITANVTTPGNGQGPTYQWFMDSSTTPFTPTIVSTTALTQTILITEPGEHTYTVLVTVPNASNTEPITDTVLVALGPDVNVADPADVILCGFDGEAAIDLTTLNDDVLGALLPADYMVSYHLTEDDAEDWENAIDLTVPFETETTTIWVRVTSSVVDACHDVVPLEIIVNEAPEAVISYDDSPYCTNGGTATVTVTGGAGGTYTSTTGLTIDASTGAITLASSTPGTYTVTYTIPAGPLCPEFSTTTEVIIEAAPEATITYAGTPYCSTGTATVSHTGTTGGVYSSTAGLVINAATGEVDLAASTAGTYTVTYTVAATAACDGIAVTTEITINTQFTAAISYTGSPYCSNDAAATVTQTGDGGGTYSSTAGLVIDAATGEIDLAASTAGTYTVTYTIAASTSCPEFTTTAQVVIEAAPEATIAYAGTPYCSNGGTATVSLTGTQGGVYSSTAGLTIDAATGDIDLAASTAGTYTVTYTVAATTACDGISVTTEVTITALPVATIAYAASPYCSDAGVATVTQTGNTGGTYTSTAGLSINGTTGDIDLAASTAGTYTVTYTIAAANGCSDVLATTTVTITQLPTAGFIYTSAAVCQNAGTVAPTLNAGATAGTYTSDAGLTIDPVTGVINPATSTVGTYTVTNTVAGANGCGDVTATFEVTINFAPVAEFTYDAVAYCQDLANPSPILEGVAGNFTSTTGLVINPATGVVDLAASTPGTYTVTNTVPGTPDCPAVVATTTVTITSIPVVAVLQGCEGSTYMLEVSFDGDDIYTADNVEFVWTNSSGVNVGSEAKITVAAPDTYHLTVIPMENGECSMDVDVVVESTSCDVQRGISPNNDGMNDSFDLTALDVRKLGIFNRYGQEVYSHGNGYTDQWEGQGSGGEELPTGTYFYMIERNNGESKTGWIYINREE